MNISKVEAVITNGAPLVVVAHLQSATSGFTGEAEVTFNGARIRWRRWKRWRICTAFDTNIFVMTTVVIAPANGGALTKRTLLTIAPHIQPDRVCASTSGVDGVNIVVGETQLLASDRRIRVIKTVIANGAPLSVVVDLQSTTNF